MRSLITDLSYDGVFDEDTTTLTEKTAAATDSQLVEWRSKLKSLIAQYAIVKAEKDQKNVIGGPSDFQLETVANAARDSLSVVESEMRKRNLIK